MIKNGTWLFNATERIIILNLPLKIICAIWKDISKSFNIAVKTSIMKDGQAWLNVHGMLQIKYSFLKSNYGR